MANVVVIPDDDRGGVMYGWQRDITTEQREQYQLETYEAALLDIVQRLAARTITPAQVRNLMRAVMLRVDRDWDPTDYAAMLQQASQN